MKGVIIIVLLIVVIGILSVAIINVDLKHMKFESYCADISGGQEGCGCNGYYEVNS